MRTDRFQGFAGASLIPDVQPPIVRRCQDVRVLAVVLNLGGAGEPVAKCEYRLSWASKIPTVYVTVDSARRELIWMVRRPIDVGDGSAVALERVLYGA